MSPRAAWRLESLGFGPVYDYVAGEADWFASGLPGEGRAVTIPRAGDRVVRDVPTCGLTDRIGTVRNRVRAAGWDTCLVVNEARVVLGRLRGAAFEAPEETVAEQVMEPGPSTIRPDTRLDEITERMRTRKIGSVIVTTSDGQLVGVLRSTDAEGA